MSIAKTVDRPNYFVECPNCGNTELSYVRGEFTGMHDSTCEKCKTNIQIEHA